MGIQISGVDNAEEARAIAQEAKYPPIGNRGISQMGPHTGYRGYGARYHAGLKARAGRAHARLKSIGVRTP